MCNRVHHLPEWIFFFLFLIGALVLGSIHPPEVEAAFCDGTTAPCSEDPVLDGCVQCHSMAITGANRDGTDRFLTVSTGARRHVVDPKMADWTSTVQSMINKGAQSSLSKTAAYLNTNYCDTCNGPILSSPTVTDKAKTSATINWSSSWTGFEDEPTSGIVYYSTNISDLDLIDNNSTCPHATVSCVEDAGGTSVHALGLTGLEEGTTYYFKTQSSSRGVTTTYARAQSFTTSGGACGTPARSLAYATSRRSTDLWVFDRATLSLLEKIQVGTSADVVAQPDGSLVYVATAINIQELIPGAPDIRSITLPDGFTPAFSGVSDVDPLALSPDGTQLYVLTFDPSGAISQRIYVIDTATFTVSGYLSSGSPTTTLHDLALSTDGRYLYAAGRDASSPEGGYLITIDTETGIRTSLIPLRAGRLGVTPDGTRLVITMFVRGHMFIYSLTNPAVPAHVVTHFYNREIGNTMGDFVIAPDSRTAYVMNSLKLLIIDIEAGVLLATIPDVPSTDTGSNAGTGIAYDADANRVWSVSGSPANVYISDPTALTFSTLPFNTGGSAITLVDVPAGPPCAPTVLVDSVSVARQSTTIGPGQTEQFNATVKDIDGIILNDIPVSWTSSNPNVCEVDADGLATGVGIGGPVQITASAQGVSASASCTVVNPMPDAQAYALSANLAGSVLFVTNTVLNQGNVKIDSVSADIYLSPDSVVTGSGNDIQVGGRSVTELQPGAPSSDTTAISLDTVPAGLYYVGLVVDQAGLLAETNETNNTKVTTGTFLIGPDLKVFSISAAVSGTNLIITDTEQNIGNQAADAFTAAFYLSPTTTPNPATDTLLGSRTLTGLAGGSATQSATTTLSIPSSTPTGTYYVCAISDSGGVISELNESNNHGCTNGTFTIGPDLTIYTLVASLSGTNIIITDTELNSGNQGTGPFTVSFYFSTSTTPNPQSDTLIGSRQLNGLGGGSATNTKSSIFPIPVGISTGTYRVCAVSDSANAVAELNEANNTRCTTNTFFIGPDLRVYGLSVSKSGSTFIVTDTQLNGGNAPAGPYTVSFYLSLNNSFDSGDIFLGSRTVSELGGGNKTQTATTQHPTPAAATPGSYFVIAVSDANNAISETNENNNTKATGGTYTIP